MTYNVFGGMLNLAQSQSLNLLYYCEHGVDPEAKARASGSEREMGQARAKENFSRSEREK